MLCQGWKFNHQQFQIFQIASVVQSHTIRAFRQHRHRRNLKVAHSMHLRHEGLNDVPRPLPQPFPRRLQHFLVRKRTNFGDDPYIICYNFTAARAGCAQITRSSWRWTAATRSTTRRRSTSDSARSPSSSRRDPAPSGGRSFNRLEVRTCFQIYSLSIAKILEA